MAGPIPDLNRVAIVIHPQMPEAAPQAEVIADSLRQAGLQAVSGFLYEEPIRQLVRDGEIDMLVALGGDGTMLRAGHLCGPARVPILGINLGKFGFLTEIAHDHWQNILSRLMSGDFWLEQRMMLSASVYRQDHVLGSWDVLNEVVVSRGEMVRPVHLQAYVDGRFLTTYVADALIASTATGSTAYALAAGGPILPPELRNILLVAVAPHLSIDRAIVLPEGSAVRIIVRTDHQAVLSPDGQAPIDLQDGDQVEARASDHTTQFIRFQDPGYFYRNLTPYMYQNPVTGNHR
jgi:NAD+ kinase